MSTISPTAPNGQSSQGLWSTIASWFIPPVAAGIAVIPVYPGFEIKTEQQLRPFISGKQRRMSLKDVKEKLKGATPMSVKEALKRGCKAAPTIGVIVGIQTGAQSLCEEGLKALKRGTNEKQKQTQSFPLMLLSSMFVGVASAPALAVFNGGTMKPPKTPMESLRSLSAMQTCAIVARETSFLFSLRVSGPVVDYMERKYGKNKAVEYGSVGVTGAIVSAIGHPADTALTLWQKGRKVEHVSQLMRGAPMKAATMGGFFIGYKAVKDFLNSNSE